MPITTNLDRVRLLIGDVDSARPLLNDDEVEFFLTEREENVYLAASDACEAIAARLAREPQAWSADGQAVTNGDRAKQYRDLARQLRRGVGAASGVGLGSAMSINRTVDLDLL